jgi:hypothetical protein
MAQILNILFRQYYKNVQVRFETAQPLQPPKLLYQVKAIQVVKNVHLDCI